MLPKSIASLLLLGAVCAQNPPSIEDMLADNNDPMHTQPAAAPSNWGAAPSPNPQPSQSHWGEPSPSHSDSQDSSSPSSPFGGAMGGGGGTNAKMAALGTMMNSMQSSMSDHHHHHQGPDMFGHQPQSGGGGGLMGGMMNNPIMHQLLHSVEAKMPMNQKLAQKNGIQQPISQQSREIVSGIVEKFMHKVHLNPGEKSCLEHNLATLTADVVGTTEDIVRAVKAVIAGRPGQGLGVHLRAKSQGTLVSAGLDGAMKITSLVTLATTLMKNCVQGDALRLLNETGAHFINMRYIGERFLVSGVDIAHRLSDGIIAFEKQDWHRFGEDIGISLRKILLSNATRGAALPEGVPEQAIIQETTEGLMKGFFGRGTGMEITDAAAPEVDIQLDLHRCIAGNHEFFKEIWLALWNLVAELSMNPGGHGLKEIFSGHSANGGQPKWMGELMVAMMQVPMALSRCNIDKDTQQMMMQAIKSIKYLRVNFLFPRHLITAEEATKRMAKAVEAWTNWDFKDFGKQIGKLLEEFVLLMYPQQYAVYKHSRLQKQLSGRSNGIRVAGATWSPSFLASIAGGASLSMLVMFVAMRGFRSVSRNYMDPSSVEDGVPSDGELGDNFIEVE